MDERSRVIETVMFFALGFLVASLCALLVLPAVNARAARLAQRRLQGLFPLSVSEIAAEKDYLRARFAVAQRRLERKVEAARAGRHADMAAIGARTLEIAALSREVETREAAMAQTLETLGTTERDLAAARTDGAVGLATLQVLEDAHREILDDLLALRGDAGADPEGESATSAGVLDELRMQHAALVAEHENLRASLDAAEAALVRHSGAGESAELRRRITEVADALMQRERLPSVGAFPMPNRSGTDAV